MDASIGSVVCARFQVSLTRSAQPLPGETELPADRQLFRRDERRRADEFPHIYLHKYIDENKQKLVYNKGYPDASKSSKIR